MCEKSLITPNTDRWPYEGKREKRRLKEMSTTRVLHDAQWKLDDGASSRSSTKRNSCARVRSDTTLCCVLIGYINAAGQRKTTRDQSESRCLSSAQRGWHEWGSQTIFLCFLIFLCNSEWNFLYITKEKLMFLIWRILVFLLARYFILQLLFCRCKLFLFVPWWSVQCFSMIRLFLTWINLDPHSTLISSEQTLKICNCHAPQNYAL